MRVKDSIKYLLRASETHRSVIEDPLAYKSLFYVTKLSRAGYKDLSTHKNYEMLICAILTECHKNVAELDFAQNLDLDFSDVNARLSPNAQRVSALYLALSLVNVFAAKLHSFNINYVKLPNGLESHFAFLNDDVFLGKAVNVKMPSLDGGNGNTCGLVKLFLANMQLLSRFSNDPDNQKMWSDSHAIDVLLKVSGMVESFSLVAVQTVINIAEDRHIEALRSETTSMIKLLAGYFIAFWRELRDNMLARTQCQIIDPIDQELKRINVYCIQDPSAELSLPSESISFVDIVHGLQRLALNDKTRLEIYQTTGSSGGNNAGVVVEVNNGGKTGAPASTFKLALRRMVFAANDLELDPLLKLMVQLTFNAKIATDMSKESDLVGFLQRSATRNETPKAAEIKKSSEIILWNLKQGHLNAHRANTFNKSEIKLPPKPLAVKPSEPKDTSKRGLN
jgi:hypothetical protein